MATAGDAYRRGLANMMTLAESSVGDMNEASTRFHLIDELLLNCLDYSKTDISVELHVSPGFADYVVGQGVAQMVVEAKREGSTFVLPAGFEGRATVSLPTLLTDKTTKDAIEQCLTYAQRLGIALAAVCNGSQLIVFLASRNDGVAPLSGEALIFSSLRDMADNFRRLWDYLSRHGLKTKKAHQALAMNHGDPIAPNKLSTSIRGFPGFRQREKRDSDLHILAGVFIQDIEGSAEVSDEFLRECYYESGTLSQYAAISRDILRARYRQVPDALAVDALPIRDKKSLDSSLRQDLLTTSLNSKPVAIIGDVGVGKTMFLRHLLRIDASELLAGALTFYLDFGSRPALQEDLQSFVYDEVVRQLVEEYERDVYEDKFVRAVYNSELNRFRKGVYGPLFDSDKQGYASKEIEYLGSLIADKMKHLERSLAHLEASARVKSIIVLDNIDQRPHGFQDQLFVIAQSLASTLRASVFISLRPTTFFDSKARGTLAAYQPRAFYVEPPRISEVVNRRLKFARTQIENAQLPIPGSPSDLSLSSDDLLGYLDALQSGFGSDSNLMALLDNLSSGNVRIALDLLSSFIGSGYVSTERVLSAPSGGAVYKIPMHEVLRAIIYGENGYYDPTTSRVVNLFDVLADDRSEHFLMSELLALAEEHGKGSENAGFVDTSKFLQSAQTWGFSESQIFWQLRRAHRGKLLESPLSDQPDEAFRITASGSYMVKTVISQFAYVDAMVTDIPIVDVPTRSQISDCRPILERLDRASILRDYLDVSWLEFASGVKLPLDWTPLSATLGRNIADARERAQVAVEKRGKLG